MVISTECAWILIRILAPTHKRLEHILKSFGILWHLLTRVLHKIHSSPNIVSIIAVIFHCLHYSFSSSVFILFFFSFFLSLSLSSFLFSRLLQFVLQIFIFSSECTFFPLVSRVLFMSFIWSWRSFALKA